LSSPELVATFFRHEHGRLVATLARRVGARHIEAVEDAVQAAMMAALESWPRSGQPDNPSAWLYRVAHNALLAELRARSRRGRLLEQHMAGAEPALSDAAEPCLTGDVHDDLLRMLFVCCDEQIPVESQLVLALKTLCGFSAREIAHRLFLSEASTYKRLTRARSRLRKLPACLEEPTLEQQASRLPGVRAILYLLFTEGYLSSHPDSAIRRELCHEAIRLMSVLTDSALGQTPETFALLALMHLHAARLAARQDARGGLLLLEEQDRSLWDREQIRLGLSWLARSASGEVFSRYHAEAGIAAEHCLAASVEETRWERIAECYAQLQRLAPSPLHELSRAVAVAEWQGPKAGLAVLDTIEPPTWLSGSHLWASVLADLHRRSGNGAEAKRYRDLALASAPTAAVRELLERRLDATTRDR
jgi:RNA polymerase sigma-70 factor (ECF subfamily)